MYFLSQIKEQFICSVYSQYADAQWQLAYEQAAWVWTSEIQEDFSQDQISSMNSSDILEELKERLDIVKAWESIVWTKADVLMRFCLKVKNNEVHGYTTADADYQRLVDMVHQAVAEYKGLTWEAAEIDDAIRVELFRIGGHVDREIESPEENEILSEEENIKTTELRNLDTQRISLSRDVYSQINEIQSSNTWTETSPALFEVSDKTAGLLVLIDELWSEELEGSIDERITRIEEINQEILELNKQIDLDYEIAVYETRLQMGGLEPLDEEEILELNRLELEYRNVMEPIDLRLQPYNPSEENTQSMKRVFEIYTNLNTSIIDEMTDREKLEFLRSDASNWVTELSRLVDIAIRDQEQVWTKEESLWETRLDSVHESYNKILENEEIRDALTSKDWEIPTFEELDMSHIVILRDKWVNLSELFLVNENGSSFSWEIEVGGIYIINFSTNSNLEGELNFSFLNSDVEKINLDGKELNFEWDRFESNGIDFSMKDGSRIEVVSKFGENEQESESRHEAASEYMDSLWTSATHRRIVNEALASSDPQAAFEWKTLPGWLAWFFIAMILNLGDGRNFQYNSEKWIWEDIEEWIPLTNEGIINNNMWVYYNDTWERVDISSSFEDLPNWVWPLINTIYQAESGGDPNIIYSGCPIQPPRPITQMTVREVRIFQDRMVAAWSESSAVWACQIIKGTMDGAIRAGVLDPNSKFDIDAQNRFTIWKMEQRGLNRFMSWQVSQEWFMESLAKEWASLPKDMWGASYYAWDGLNHALVSPQTITRHLREIWQW